MAASIASSRMLNPDKGARYIGQLDTALCSGNWAEIPELARKAEKHSPARACLCLAAKAEAKIATASARPGATTSPSDLVELVPQLEQCIAARDSSEEDAFVASLALAKIYWLGKSHDAAFRILPEKELAPSSNNGYPSVLGWLEVCNVQIPYMKISLLTALGQESGIQDAFQQAISTSTTTRSPELRKWTERLLAGICLFFSETSVNSPSTYSLGEALRVFWAWNEFWSRSPPPSTPKNRQNLLRIDVPRREVWKRYYDLLSTVLSSGLLYNLKARSPDELLIYYEPGMLSDEKYTEARLNQFRELKRVESTYESILLQDTQFPEAEQDNTEVEEWINQAIANWRILEASWSPAALGKEGKAGLGQGVLEILYRAATKTFHSTVILRELFNIHSSLGEFDLAMHAFDSYVDIVTKAKARASKTGHRDATSDSDDVAVQTAASAIHILCRYGSRPQAEKALKIGEDIEMWLAEQSPHQPDEVQTHTDDNYAASSSKPRPAPTERSLKAVTLAAAYRAIGQSKAQWARLTSDTGLRSSLQSEAIDILRLSEEQDPESIETAYALALVLADTRDVMGAIAVLRTVLAMHPTDPDESEQTGDYSKQRKLIPLWHLLALCLTAKDQNDAAIRMCDAAFEQFGHPATLFGSGRPRSSADGAHRSDTPRGVVDSMEPLEKESMLQIKMSQLSFIEVTEGASVAVDMSDELLGLFTRLFGTSDQGRTQPDKAIVMVRPASPEAKAKTGGRNRSTSRLRNIVSSLRPGSRAGSRAASRADSRAPDSGRNRSTSVSSLFRKQRVTSPTPDQANGAPLTVSVTNPDGSVSKVTPAGNTLNNARHLKNTSLETESADSVFRRISQRARSRLNNDHALVNGVANEAAVDASAEQAHTRSDNQFPPPTGAGENPLQQDTRLPVPAPGTTTQDERFPQLQERRHKIGLLVGVWLYIAQLYLHADMLEDASGAIVEASKLAESLEVEIAGHESSAREFANKGWGGAKSIDELMADIWAVNGDLANARKLHHKAAENYERALALFPDHATAIIGLSEILMDIYEEKLPAEDSRPLLPPLVMPIGSLIDIDGLMAPAETNAAFNPSAAVPQPRAFDKDPSPAALNRLAARDRAYMLTSNLTRLGTGWDNADAWLTLARAHELSKQIAKAKQALWWVVELEDNRPMRSWQTMGAGGFTL